MKGNPSSLRVAANTGALNATSIARDPRCSTTWHLPFVRTPLFRSRSSSPRSRRSTGHPVRYLFNTYKARMGGFTEAYQRCQRAAEERQCHHCCVHQLPRRHKITSAGQHLKAQHLPGKENLNADFMCRHLRDRTDWILNPTLFDLINQMWGPLQVDIFAMRLSH